MLLSQNWPTSQCPIIDPLNWLSLLLSKPILMLSTFSCLWMDILNLDLVDHICFHPLAQTFMEQVVSIKRFLAVRIDYTLQGLCAPLGWHYNTGLKLKWIYLANNCMVLAIDAHALGHFITLYFCRLFPCLEWNVLQLIWS